MHVRGKEVQKVLFCLRQCGTSVHPDDAFLQNLHLNNNVAVIVIPSTTSAGLSSCQHYAATKLHFVQARSMTFHNVLAFVQARSVIFHCA